MADKKFSDYSNDATPADGDKLLLENAAATDSFNTTYAQLLSAINAASKVVDLMDVTVASLAEGEFLRYDATDERFENREFLEAAKIDSDGTTEVVWDDLRFPASAVRVGSVRPASEEAYKGGIVLSFADGRDESIYFNAQLPHGYKLGTNLDFHVHIALPTSGAGAGAENVKFDMTYSWASIGSDFPAETTITATRDVQNDNADKHILFDIGDVLTSNMAGSGGVSEMLICSLTRDVSVADNYADDVYLIEADFHYQADQIGSFSESAKRP